MCQKVRKSGQVYMCHYKQEILIFAAFRFSVVLKGHLYEGDPVVKYVGEQLSMLGFTG